VLQILENSIIHHEATSYTNNPANLVTIFEVPYNADSPVLSELIPIGTYIVTTRTAVKIHETKPDKSMPGGSALAYLP
jgi:hypothetical protein